MWRIAFLACVAGCFGTGPSPGEPSKATLLFALELHPLKQDNCMTGSFIGNVAIGSDAAYAVTHAFLPACNGGGGSPSDRIPSAVFQFSKTLAGPPMKIGDAGMVQEAGGSRPHVAAFGTEAVWMFSDPGSSTLHVRSKNATISGDVTLPSNVASAASVVLDDTKTYVAGWSGPNGAEHPNHPRYPCCGSSGMGSPSYALVQLANTTNTTVSALPTPNFFTQQMKDSLVANTTTLFFVGGAPSTIIGAQPKTGGASEQVATVMGQPAGLAADDTHVAWSTNLDFTKFASASPPPAACSVFVTTTSAPHTPTTLLSTMKFSCLDLAIDGDFIYFTIISLEDGESDSFIRNLGIGRISIASREFESIALGIPGPEAGPRELFIDGDGIIAVAPFAVARVSKSALDGEHAFTP